MEYKKATIVVQFNAVHNGRVSQVDCSGGYTLQVVGVGDLSNP